MSEILSLIEGTLGKATLQLVAAAMVLYFAITGAVRLYESFRAVVHQRGQHEATRANLEILKLRLEIEALKEAHGLTEPEELRGGGEPLPAPAEPTRRSAREYGTFGLVACGLGYFIVGALAWLGLATLILGVRYVLAGNRR